MTMIATQTEEEIQRQVRVIREAAKIVLRTPKKSEAFLRALDPDFDKRKNLKKRNK